MKDKIWQKARDKKHFIRDEIYWWQRERTLMGHAHILWVLLSAARIAVRALNCITCDNPTRNHAELAIIASWVTQLGIISSSVVPTSNC